MVGFKNIKMFFIRLFKIITNEKAKQLGLFHIENIYDTNVDYKSIWIDSKNRKYKVKDLHNEMKQHHNLKDMNVMKCFGCREGNSLFMKDCDKIFHVDLFATSNSGEVSICSNSDIIKNFLTNNNSKKK